MSWQNDGQLKYHSLDLNADLIYVGSLPQRHVGFALCETKRVARDNIIRWWTRMNP
jgi:hypothetical protein